VWYVVIFRIPLQTRKNTTADEQKYDRKTRWSNDLWLWNRCHRRGAQKSKRVKRRSEPERMPREGMISGR
jgi:hypothetical protein